MVEQPHTLQHYTMPNSSLVMERGTTGWLHDVPGALNYARLDPVFSPGWNGVRFIWKHRLAGDFVMGLCSETAESPVGEMGPVQWGDCSVPGHFMKGF